MAAADTDGGLLAIMAEGESEPKGESETTPKARALKAMWAAMKAGNWNGAADAFQDAYDECAMSESEPEPELD